MAALGFYACQKEDSAIPGGTALEEVNVTPRVQAFLANASHHTSSREGGLITADSALWYVEAALNYSYTDISTLYSDQVVDTIAISIPVVDGQVLETDAGNAYATLGQVVNTGNVAGTSHVAIVDVSSTNT